MGPPTQGSSPSMDTRGYPENLMQLFIGEKPGSRISYEWSIIHILEARCMKIRAIGLPSSGCRRRFSSSTWDPGCSRAKPSAFSGVKSSAFRLGFSRSRAFSLRSVPVCANRPRLPQASPPNRRRTSAGPGCPRSDSHLGLCPEPPLPRETPHPLFVSQRRGR